MASKIHTDNTKHHKYVTTNKQERKKNNIDNINYNKINIINFKSFLSILESVIISCQYSYRYIYQKFGFTQGTHTNYLEPNYNANTNSHIDGNISEHHGIKASKGTVVIYDDCNHKTFRVYNKKKHKFINSIYKKQRYSDFYIAPKYFKR